MGKIRNIIQTTQERELTKTAPDMVVYLEGLPYLKNQYLTTNPNNPVLVNFNDHFASFNATYGVDNTIPTATIQLTVPAHLRYLYQSPGGNNIVKSMMQVQVYCKGFYYSSKGNTLYHRIFKGVTSHITHSDDGKMLTITIQCQGILALFERMQIELSPAIMSSSPIGTVPYKNVMWNMNPYLQMAFAFMYPSFTDGFYVNSIFQPNIQTSDYFQAVENNFIAKWQTILASICQETHIYGLLKKDVKSVLNFLNDISKKSTVKGTKSWSFLGDEETVFSNIKESNQATDQTNVNKIRQFHPDYTVGAIQLTNGNVVPRLELVKNISRLINYEFYQDIDGQIILKPPLYNLDVTNLGNANSEANAKYTATHPTNDITSKNNPFVANLAEIFGEVETEDQQAVQATRMVIRGSTTVGTQFVQIDPMMRGVSEYIDIPKLTQFGLREEPAHNITWLRDNDPKAMFAQAAGELALANRGYRTYAFNMPLKPELKLGFPMYIPHKDMYGYINQIGINFQIGGAATMSVTLDTLRKRPLYPEPYTTQGAAPTGGKKTSIFVAQPNLVLKWTQGTADPTAANNTTTNANGEKFSFAGAYNHPNVPGSPANLNNVAMTLPKPPDTNPPSSQFGGTQGITKDQAALIAYQQAQLGSYFSISSDTADRSWRVQFDNEHIWSADTPQQVGSFYRVVNEDYYKDIRNTIPYTDEKGYEVVAPFPWGRWVDLKTAVQEFTRDGYVYKPSVTDTNTTALQNTDAFLFAGLGTPTSTNDAAAALGDALNKLQQQVGVTPSNVGSNRNVQVLAAPPDLTTGEATTNPDGTLVTTTDDSGQGLLDFTIFELSYTKTAPGGSASIINTGQPDNQTDIALLQNSTAMEQAKVSVFLTGKLPQPSNAFKTQVAAIGNKVGAGAKVTPLSNP